PDRGPGNSDSWPLASPNSRYGSGKNGSGKVADVSLGAGVSPPAAPVLRTGDEILAAFAGPGRQRRVTVLFRLLLVIPHYIVLYALGIAVAIVAIIGWFAALFTGRL